MTSSMPQSMTSSFRWKNCSSTMQSFKSLSATIFLVFKK